MHFRKIRNLAFSTAIGCLFAYPAFAEQEGTFGFFRWTDDFDYLDDRVERSGVERLKRIPLGANSDLRLSFGGDYRFRIDAFAQPDYGLFGSDEFTSVQHRFRLHGDLQFSGRARIFGQLGYYIEDGREPRSRSIDASDPDIEQLFVDLGLGGSLKTEYVRIGRQSLTFGSTRLFGSREGSNIRRTFDAIRVVQTIPGGSIQAFVGSPVAVDPSAFSNEADSDELTWGVYATFDQGDRLGAIDAYYIGRQDDTQLWAQGIDEEERHTVGLRFYGVQGPWDFDVEAAYQFGTFGDGDISAWAIGSDTGYTFREAAWSPRVGLRVDIASGDDDPGDPDLHSFNALYPNLAYFSDAATFFPTNAVDFHPYVQFKPRRDLRVELGANAIFRLNGDDAIYASGPRVLVAPGGSDLDLATVLFRAKATWQINRNVTGLVSFVHGTAGPAIKDAGGEAFSHVLLQLNTRF